MTTRAPLMPKGVPACVVPSIVRLELTAGRAEARVMVLPAWLWSAKLKLIRSGVADPLAAACVKASRKVPGPLSALEVTGKVVAMDLVASQSRSKVRIRGDFIVVKGTK